MPEVTQHAEGSFCWIELGTSDSAAAKKFYSELLGWASIDTPAGPTTYTLLQIDGKDIGGLYQLSDEHKGQGIPSNWLSYVSVSDADKSAERAKQLGGNVITGPFEVFDLGRLAVFQDPTGATCALWQARTHIGARLVNQPRTMCWNELATRDTAKAADFYTALFGWTTKSDTGPNPYTEFINGGTPIGGMLALGEQQAGVPPHWMPYISVEDCDATANKAKSLGATLFVPPTDIPNVGRFAVVQDPQGAVFGTIKLTHP